LDSLKKFEGPAKAGPFRILHAISRKPVLQRITPISRVRQIRQAIRNLGYVNKSHRKYIFKLLKTLFKKM